MTLKEAYEEGVRDDREFGCTCWEESDAKKAVDAIEEELEKIGTIGPGSKICIDSESFEVIAIGIGLAYLKGSGVIPEAFLRAAISGGKATVVRGS